MKISPNEKKCKKKRKPQRQLKHIIQTTLTDCIQLKNALPTIRNLRSRNPGYIKHKNALPNVRNLRPPNPSSIKHALTHLNYKFQVTRAINRKIHAIKRTIINESVTPININRISMNDRIRNRGSSVILEKFELKFSSKFLEDRSFKMANGADSTNSNESFPKVTITFEQMLNIRKKRLDKKHRRSSQKTDTVVEIVDQTPTIVGKNDQINCSEVIYVEEITQNQDVIEIKDDSVIIDCENIKDDSVIIDCENNNMEKSCEIQYDMDQTGENRNVNIGQPNGTNLTPEISSNIIQNVSHEDAVYSTEKNGLVIELDSCPINDSVINSTISKMPSEELPNKISADDIAEQSVILTITPDQYHRTPQIFTQKARQTRWSSNNSIITISDTSSLCQSITDDIMFESTECRSPTVPAAKQRRLDRKPSVVVIDDDDSRHPVSHQSRSSLRKRKYKKRVKKKKRGCGATPTPPSSTITKELASYADINCINTPNCNPAAQPCSSQQSNGAFSLKPYGFTMLEQSATTAHNKQDSRESQKGLFIQNYLLHVNGANNKFGSNIHNTTSVVREGLRQIIIDGSNIALGHSNGRVFSVKGLQIAIDYFIKKRHKVKAFVPQYRLKFDQCTNPHLLRKLVDERLVILTPSREVKGRRITPYDDRIIIQYATTCEGIIVSNDNYRDLLKEKPEWQQTIEKRLLMYTWIDDVLIFPEDPLGRHGPNLSRFLRFPTFSRGLNIGIPILSYRDNIGVPYFTSAKRKNRIAVFCKK